MPCFFPFFSRQSDIQRAQVAVKHDISTSQRWNSHGSPGKLVLCCSALTVAEKVKYTSK